VTSDDSPDSGNQEYSLTGVFDDMLTGSHGEHIAIGEVVAAFRQQAYGPLLLIPSLIALMPVVGAIPGLSIVMASLIILVSAQMMFGRKHPWVPARLRRFSVRRKRLERAVGIMRPYLKTLDRWTRPRLLLLSEPPFLVLIPIVCILLALLMFPLALVPWGVAPPALALTVLSVGLTIRDGYVLAAGYAVTILSVIASIHLW